MYFKDIKQTCVHITHIYICVPLLIADRCFPPHVQTIQSVCLLVEPTDHVPKIGQHMGDAVTRHQDSIHHCIAWFFILQSRKVHSFLSFTKIETYVYTYIYILYTYILLMYTLYTHILIISCLWSGKPMKASWLRSDVSLEVYEAQVLEAQKEGKVRIAD